MSHTLNFYKIIEYNFILFKYIKLTLLFDPYNFIIIKIQYN